MLTIFCQRCFKYVDIHGQDLAKEIDPEKLERCVCKAPRIAVQVGPDLFTPAGLPKGESVMAVHWSALEGDGTLGGEVCDDPSPLYATPTLATTCYHCQQAFRKLPKDKQTSLLKDHGIDYEELERQLRERLIDAPIMREARCHVCGGPEGDCECLK